MKKDAVNRFLLGVGACLAVIRQPKSRRFLWRSAVAAGALIALFPPSVLCQVPEFFGTYAVVDSKLAPLIGGRGTFTPGHTDLQVYDFQKMSVETEKVLVFEGGDMRFTVFDAAVADTSAGLELYKLPYARNLITRPDALAQVGGLLDQVSGRAKPGSQPQSAASPLQKYVVAKTDALKVELLQKPVPGQPQMIQLVPASNLEPGMYCLFAVRSQGGQQVIVGQPFEWKGQSGSAATPYCIDLAKTGGFGGMMDESDSRMLRPYYLAKEKYVNCRTSNTSTPPPSAIPPGGTGGGSVAAGACSDYNACLQAAMNAYKSRDWPSATAAFQAAANQRPASAEPWVWLGRILLRDGQPHRLQDLSVWDKALSLGADLMIGACHERTLQPCERGDLSLSSKSVSFLASGSRAVFSSAPNEIEPGRILNNSAGMHIAYSMRVAGKNYMLDFIPLLDVTCTFNLMVQCPQEGITQQLLLAQYVSQVLPKLARGTLNATVTPPSVSTPATNPGPSTSPSNSACSQAVDSGYAVLLQGHLYKVRLAGPAGPEQRPFFFDEKGAQVTDSSLLPQLASAVWTHDNLIASQDARNGSNRVSGILGTSKALQTYTTVQDALARAMVEAIQAGFTGGASLSKAVPNVTLGILKAQLLNAPKTLLTLTAQHGLETSLAGYRQMEAVPLPPQDATALNATDLTRIKDLYVQARSLELPYAALAAKLMPTNAGELTEQALKSALSEVAGGPLFSGAQSDVVTLKGLLDLQKGIANLAKSLPALQAYSQDLNLATNLTAANSATISKWASAAGQKCN